MTGALISTVLQDAKWESLRGNLEDCAVTLWQHVRATRRQETWIPTIPRANSELRCQVALHGTVPGVKTLVPIDLGLF